MVAVSQELRQVSVFADLPDGALDRLSGHARTRQLSRGQLLFSQGEPTDHLYVVRSGTLRVVVSSPHGDDLTLRLLKPGDTIGELSVLDGQPRSASVEAQETSELIVVPATEVRAVLQAHPAAMLSVIEQLAAGVRRLTESAADLVFLDVPRRLAKLLIAESQVNADGRTVCELNMNQGQVAARVGATRQSLNRALGEFGRRGWIAVEGTTVWLDDAPSLRRFADS